MFRQILQNIGVTIPFVFMTLFIHFSYQTPPKIKIYLVGLPSALYERPGQNERSVLNQLFLLLFWWFHMKSTFSGAFYEKRHFSQKV